MRPRTGYELSRHLRAPVGWFWSARHSQVYPELARLAEEGLVTATVVPGRGPRDTKRYAVTELGRERLRSWVTSPLDPDPVRSELLLRVRSLWLVDPARALAFLVEQRERARERLAGLEAERQAFAPDDVVGHDHPEHFAWASLQLGLAHGRATMEWFDRLVEQSRAAAETVPGTTGRPTDEEPP